MNIDAIYSLAQEFDEAVPHTQRSGLVPSSDRPAPVIEYSSKAEYYNGLATRYQVINNLSRIAGQFIASKDVNKMFKDRLNLLVLTRSMAANLKALNIMLGL